MPSILQGSFSLSADGANQAVGHGALQGHRGAMVDFLKAAPFKQCGDQLFSGSLVFYLHAYALLAHRDLPDRSQETNGTYVSVQWDSPGTADRQKIEYIACPFLDEGLHSSQETKRASDIC